MYDSRYCDDADIAEQVSINRMNRRIRANHMLHPDDPEREPCFCTECCPDEDEDDE